MELQYKMTFIKGQSGNPGGKLRQKPFTDALRMEICEAGDDHKKLRRIARKLLAMAEASDMAAIRELADRLEGKVAITQVIQGDEEGDPVRYYAEVPKKAATTQQWLADLSQENLESSDDRLKH